MGDAVLPLAGALPPLADAPLLTDALGVVELVAGGVGQVIAAPLAEFSESNR